MGKKLLEMSLEELWELFPIILTEHHTCWKDWYENEESILKGILSGWKVERISHIGSTSINGIWAKPIIDILVEVSPDSCLEKVKDVLLNNGYLCMNQSKDRFSFNKGYTEHGFAEKVYHLHLRYAGDNSELYFRDYLLERFEIAKKYDELKLKLWKKYEYNRDDYTNAKTEFVSIYTKKAKELYGERYC